MAKKTAGQERENPVPAPDNRTEGKRDGEELRESERRLRAIVEAAPIPMVISRVSDGLILHANEHLGRTFGLPSEDLVGRKTLDFYYDPAERQEVLDLLRRDGYVRDYEVRAKREDGTPFWAVVSIQTTPFTGAPVLIAGFYDITERKRAEEALRESEERSRALVENSPEGLSLTDLEGRVLFCNKQALALLGYESMQEVLGRNAFDLIAPEDRQRAVDNAQKTLNMKSISHVEYAMVRKDGSRFPAEMGASLVVDAEGKPKGFIGVVRDITERKRAEEALRHSEERYRALYDDNPSMYFTVDTEGTVLSVNRFGADQLGYTDDELVGQSVLRTFHDDDKEAVREQLSACVRNPAEVAQCEFRNVRKDGNLLWVKEAARAVRGPDGDTIVLIVCEDITERKRTEEALQEAREELESRVETQLQRGNTYGLTFRELTVIHLVATGKSDKEIGALLSISPRTANKHVQNILTKMGASSRTEAGVRAVREGLAD